MNLFTSPDRAELLQRLKNNRLGECLRYYLGSINRPNLCLAGVDIETGARDDRPEEFLPADDAAVREAQVTFRALAEDMLGKIMPRGSDPRFVAQFADSLTSKLGPASRATDKRDKAASEAALVSLRSELLLLGVTDSKGNYAALTSDLSTRDQREKEILEKFFVAIRDRATGLVIVGWNVKFDMKNIFQKALNRGVAVPHEMLGTGKWCDGAKHIELDAMQFFSQDPRESLPLDLVAKDIGLPGKTGGFGARFGELWADPKNRPELVQYNRVDIDQSLRVAMYHDAIAVDLSKRETSYRYKDQLPDLNRPFFLPEKMVTYFDKPSQAPETEKSVTTIARSVPRTPTNIVREDDSIDAVSLGEF